MHTDSPDNGYEKDENGGYKQINNNGGDSMDYLYENGEVVETRVPFQTGGEVSYNRTYGVLANTGTGGTLYDPSWDMFQIYAGFGEIKAGLTLAKMGLTTIPKTSIKNIRAMNVGDASKVANKATVYFTKKLQSNGIKKYSLTRYPWKNRGWYTVSGVLSKNLATFLGRNASLIGGGIMIDGIHRVYKRFTF
ncbi:hypothetical protein [Apibacter sp. HY039]|uniref:hypothetical protein n=1 Tax=Apibacter sp. HY039 TaxID=2501476 RepID=UPI000FEBBE53|nr:hypothetical protein [Apibacter sp. HY039]